MHKLRIQGGNKLKGTIAVSGAKNSVLPIICAALLSDSPVTIENIPHLNDVTTMMELLAQMGAKITLSDKMSITIDSSKIDNLIAPYDLVKTMRASILILGPLLAKFGKAKVSLPGGCAIGPRPVDLHIKAMQALGAEIKVENGYIVATANGALKGGDIVFDKVSVTGTENAIMAAVLAEGKTTLRNVAHEPEIVDLAYFLNSLGASVKGAGTDTIVIDGVKSLKGGNHKVISDRIEAGTYLVAAAITKGSITLTNTNAELLETVLDKLEQAGASIVRGSDYISLDMQGKRPKAIDIRTAPFPGFPTDMQAQFTVLNSIAEGNAVIEENVFENRLMHVQELNRMGADLSIKSRVVLSQGVESLVGASVMATDLRASACLVLAGLVARGETIVDRVYHIDRGYECIEEKLSRLGANVVRSHD